MTEPNPTVTNEHVELLQNVFKLLKKSPQLINELSSTEILNLSNFSRLFTYHLVPIEHKLCIPLYHRFQELGSKYNLKRFIVCETIKRRSGMSPLVWSDDPSSYNEMQIRNLFNTINY